MPFACAGRGWGPAPTPLPGAFAPWIPDLMWLHSGGRARRPTGRLEQAAHDLGFSTTEACTDAMIVQQASFAGGLGACYAPNGERAGQRPLAFQVQSAAFRSGVRG